VLEEARGQVKLLLSSALVKIISQFAGIEPEHILMRNSFSSRILAILLTRELCDIPDFNPDSQAR
jgi:hypothetical protein